MVSFWRWRPRSRLNFGTQDRVNPWERSKKCPRHRYRLMTLVACSRGPVILLYAQQSRKKAMRSKFSREKYRKSLFPMISVQVKPFRSPSNRTILLLRQFITHIRPIPVAHMQLMCKTTQYLSLMSTVIYRLKYASKNKRRGGKVTTLSKTMHQ